MAGARLSAVRLLRKEKGAPNLAPAAAVFLPGPGYFGPHAVGLAVCRLIPGKALAPSGRKAAQHEGGMPAYSLYTVPGL